jgi:hypothetical protein
MKITVNHPLAHQMIVTDNGNLIIRAIEVDTERGYYDIYAANNNGDLILNSNNNACVHRIFSDKLRCFIDFELVTKYTDYVVDVIKNHNESA